MIAGSKIAFFYPSYYPVTGGSSVHGYYLARNLTDLGYKLFTFTSEPDGFTNHRKKILLNVLRAIVAADVVYVRLGTSGLSRRIPMLANLFGKKVIAEINGPADEIAITKLKNESDVRDADKSLARLLKRTDAVITVGKLMAEYCQDKLNCENVFAIENGGEQFNSNNLKIESSFIEKINGYRKSFGRIAIWSGTTYPWQGFENIKKLIEHSPAEIAYFLVSDDKQVWKDVEQKENVFCFEKLSRDETSYLMLRADIGLALYGDFSWSRFGEFHGSSLKYYEYIANGLCVIASPTGHLKNVEAQGVLVTEDINKMVEFISGCNKRAAGFTYRSWKDVALETSKVIESIL